MKRLFPLFLVLFALISCTSSSTPDYLFIVHADEGQYNKEASILTLKGVNDSVVYFSNYPTRRAGNLPLALFLHEWKKRHRETGVDELNAGMITYESGALENAHDVTARVSGPRYNELTGDLTFTIKVIGTDTLPTAPLKEIHLFVDEV